MEISSLIVTLAVLMLVWSFMRTVATLCGLMVIGGLVYHMHSNHPLWIEQISNAVQNWVY